MSLKTLNVFIKAHNCSNIFQKSSMAVTNSDYCFDNIYLHYTVKC
jgi:hypothetical protein